MNITEHSKITDKIDLETYHRLSGLSSSGLRYLDKSPAHFKAWKDGKIQIESKSLELGSRVHLYLESKKKFEATYVMRPWDFDGRRKECKEFVKDLVLSGREMITETEWKQVESIVQFYQSCQDRLVSIARDSDGMNEVTVLWEEQGMPMRCRPDRLIYPNEENCTWLHEEFPALFPAPFGLSICVDYKTTAKFPDPKMWYYQCKDYGYALAASHYLAGTHADAFLWIVLEVNPPYTVTRYLLSPPTRERMDERRMQLLDLLRECETLDAWPSLIVDKTNTLI